MSYTNGLHGLGNVANQAAKQAARAQAETDAATRHAANQAAKQAAQAIANAPAVDPVAQMLGFSVPKKIGGIPFWMLAAGGLMAVMFVFSGGKGKR